MAQAKIIPITAPNYRATTNNVVNIAEARRVALLHRLWAEHDLDGRAF